MKNEFLTGFFNISETIRSLFKKEELLNKEFLDFYYFSTVFCARVEIKRLFVYL